MARKLTIAIDGPGSAGKGTVARWVARTLGYRYVDTGAMYRAVALVALRRGVQLDDGKDMGALAEGLEFDMAWDGDVLHSFVDGEDITPGLREESVGRAASDVSRLPPVRAALLSTQRSLARKGGIVMDGRDIGTVVLPDADLKIYLDADLDERARRRHEELIRRGDVRSFAEVRDALELRDRQDRERSVAPLVCAPDAVRVDTTDLTLRAAVDRVLELVARRLAADAR